MGKLRYPADTTTDSLVQETACLIFDKTYSTQLLASFFSLNCELSGLLVINSWVLCLHGGQAKFYCFIEDVSKNTESDGTEMIETGFLKIHTDVILLFYKTEIKVKIDNGFLARSHLQKYVHIHCVNYYTLCILHLRRQADCKVSWPKASKTINSSQFFISLDVSFTCYL